MKLQHIVWTNFNLNLRNNQKEKDKAKWMNERLRIFETYYVPSVQNQTCKDFTWIVFFDEQIQARDIAFSCDPKPIIETVDIDNTKAEILKTLKKHVQSDTDLLILSRIDSDNMIKNNYVQMLQDVARKEPLGEVYAIDFPCGYGYSDTTKQKTTIGPVAASAFPNIAGPVTQINEMKKICRHGGQGTIDKDINRPTIEPMWVFLFHNFNQSSVLFGNPCNKIHGDFGVQL